jgi:hypothetical protein
MSQERCELDYIIIVTSGAKERFLLSTYLGQDPRILVVTERWGNPQGAGNGLGTLYAYSEARRLARARFGCDLSDELEKGKTIAIYHTAGKGIRLFPLPLVEGCKSKVKLPSNFGRSHDHFETILEVVLRSSKLFAPSNKGRLLVFWADQLFLPSQVPLPPSTHISLFSQNGKVPEARRWIQEGWHHYGLIGTDSRGRARQFEKLSPELFQKFSPFFANGFAKSLGCFSLSKELLEALLEEFAEELAAKRAHLDTDHHFWMPLSCDEATYSAVVHEEGALAHFHRMERFRVNFEKKFTTPLFGSQDIGSASLFLDYGNLSRFYHNVLSLPADNDLGSILRRFYGLPNPRPQSGRLFIDSESIVIGSNIREGVISKSVVIGLDAEKVDLHESVVMTSVVHSLSAKKALVYSVDEPGSLKMAEGTLRADLYCGENYLKLCDRIENHPKEEWNRRLPGNPYSWEELYDKVKETS